MMKATRAERVLYVWLLLVLVFLLVAVETF